MRGEGLIVGDTIWPLVVPEGLPGEGTHIPVYTWLDRRVRVPEFKPGDGFNKKRRTDIRMGVWHWTGGEGNPLVMAETLRKRKLGIEFAIDGRTGILFQFCDPSKVDTADAGYLNKPSYGVELVSYGYRAPLKGRHILIPKAGRDRGQEDVEYRGKMRRIALFRQPQIVTAVTLACLMSRALKIAPRVLEGEDGDVELGLVSPHRMSTFSGNVGHYMIDEDKLDPGPTLMRALQAGLMREYPEGV